MMLRGSGPVFRLLLSTVVIPLLVLGLGVWEMGRGTEDQWDLEVRRGFLRQEIGRMEARSAVARGMHEQPQFRRDGQLYVGPLAVQQARDAMEELDTAVSVLRVRRLLPPVTVACAGLVALLSGLAVAGAAGLARAGRGSRERLVRGFSVLRRALPPLMGAQVLLLAACAVCVVGFEALAILEVGDFSSGGVKLLGIAAVAIGACLWTAGKAVLQLRRTVDLFTPDPMVVAGRPPDPADAPGLWRLLDALAERLGALKPDNVVLGLTGGFFVSSGPKTLRPGGAELRGRTLYLPLPFLPLLRDDELAAIIGHELAHFSGSDTEYSLRFLPIYAGVERSLDAVVAAGTSRHGSLSPLIRPALRLGIFAMDRFHHAVQHWSRLREFAADAAGAGVSSPAASARALLRVSAAEPVVDGALEAAFNAPDQSDADLVGAILHAAQARGLDDPAPRLNERQPHPTDSHPPTLQRLQAFGTPPDAAALAEAAAPPPPDAAERLAALFTDPAALCRAATLDFLDTARARARAVHQAMEDAAAAVSQEEQALFENVRAGVVVLVGLGAVFALLGVAGLLLLTEGGDVPILRALALGAAAAGLGLVGYGVFVQKRSRLPFLLLRPDGLTLPGLDRPIAWSEVADMDMVIDRGRVSTRLLLLPGTPFPQRRPGGRRVGMDAARRIVSFAAGLPRGMKAQGFAELLDRYRRADAARRHLAETHHNQD